MKRNEMKKKSKKNKSGARSKIKSPQRQASLSRGCLEDSGRSQSMPLALPVCPRRTSHPRALTLTPTKTLFHIRRKEEEETRMFRYTTAKALVQKLVDREETKGKSRRRDAQNTLMETHLAHSTTSRAIMTRKRVDGRIQMT